MTKLPLFASLLFLCVFYSCGKEIVVDYSSVSVKINGKECRMFSGYHCEPINRTFVGQEYLDNVLLSFQSLYMAENYLATSPEDNDTVYVINVTVLGNKSCFKPFVECGFNKVEDSSEGLYAFFENGEFAESPILSGGLIARATHNNDEKIYTLSSGAVSFGDMIKSPHLLYGGERMVWKCKEAIFEFDAKSKDGKIIHITEGHCKL